MSIHVPPRVPHVLRATVSPAAQAIGVALIRCPPNNPADVVQSTTVLAVGGRVAAVCTRTVEQRALRSARTALLSECEG